VAVTNPEDVNAAFAEAVNSGDVERVLAFYEPDALLAPQPGERVRGHAAIREALSALVSAGGHMESRNLWCMRVGELALLRGEWAFGGTTGRSCEVVRRQPDGTWLYVLDHPFGDE
jgi:ketosteroid isomerase-like protein